MASILKIRGSSTTYSGAQNPATGSPSDSPQLTDDDHFSNTLEDIPDDPEAEDDFFDEDEDDDQDGITRVELGGRGAWLLKIPQELYDLWLKVDEPGTELGTIAITYKPSTDPNVEPEHESVVLTLPKDDKRFEGGPFVYQANVNTKRTVNQFILEESASGAPLSICERVVHEANVSMGANECLRIHHEKQLKRPRTQEMTLEELRRAEGAVTNPSVVDDRSKNPDLFSVKKKTKITNEMKATRMDKEVLLRLLFDKFDDYEYWTMNGLKTSTHQPREYLKDVLSEIAMLVRSGPYHGTYQLKPEYRRREAASSGKAPEEDGSGTLVKEVEVEEDAYDMHAEMLEEEREDEELEYLELDQ